MSTHATELSSTKDHMILVLRCEVTTLISLLNGPPHLTREMRRLARLELTSCLLLLEKLLKS